MNLEELTRLVRVQANDNVQPYFWSDEYIRDRLNEAVEEAAIRGRLIHESSDPNVCVMIVVPDQAVYPLHPSLYELTHLSYRKHGEVRKHGVILVSTEWLDKEVPSWRMREPGIPVYAIQEDTKLRLVPEPIAEGSLYMEGYRLPITKMEEPGDSPAELHLAHHVHLVQWVLAKGFSIPDMESFDPARAAEAETQFNLYFGLRPDSDLRRITREDVPHTVKAFWP